MLDYINYEASFIKYPKEQYFDIQILNGTKLNYITKHIIGQLLDRPNLKSSESSSLIHLSSSHFKLAFWYRGKEYVLYFIQKNNYSVEKYSAKFISQIDLTYPEDILNIKILSDINLEGKTYDCLLLETRGQTICYSYYRISQSLKHDKLIQIGQKIKDFIFKNFISQYLSVEPSDLVFDKYLLHLDPDSWKLGFSHQGNHFTLYGFDYLSVEDDSESRIEQIVKSYGYQNPLKCIPVKHKNNHCAYLFFSLKNRNATYLPIASDITFLVQNNHL